MADTTTRKGFRVAQDGTASASVGGGMVIIASVVATGTYLGESAALVKLVLSGGPAEWSIYTSASLPFGHHVRTRRAGIAAIGR